MKIQLTVLALALLVSASSFGAAETAQVPLEEQLKTLELPSNQAPSIVSKEKLYVIQERYLPLKFKSEVSLGMAQNLTGDSFFVTRQIELGYRFHFSDRWSVGANYATVSNDLTDEGNRLITQEGIAPNIPYARQRADLTVGYNVFYGKFRLSSDQVFYFDQYVALGPGVIRMNNGDLGAAVADAGFVFWLGKVGSARLGLKDYVYNEPVRTSGGPSNNLHAHLDLGYIF